MFGTVTPGMIADQLKTQFEVTLDKRKIHLEHPIKTLGEHEIEMRLHQDVVTKLKVRVESTTPIAAPAAEAATEGRREAPRTEKRGRRPEAAAPKTDDKGGDKTDRGDRKAKGPRPERPARVERPTKPEKAS